MANIRTGEGADPCLRPVFSALLSHLSTHLSLLLDCSWATNRASFLEILANLARQRLCGRRIRIVLEFCLKSDRRRLHRIGN